MKILQIAIILFGVVAPLFGIAQGTHYLLSGKVGHLSPPAKAYLCIGEKIDSTVIHNGVFQFVGAIDQPKPAALLINKKGTGILAGKMGNNPYSLRFFIEPGNIAVTSPDSINNAKVKAGAVNSDFDDIRVQLKSAYAGLARLNNYITTASSEVLASKGFGESCEQQFAAIAKDQRKVYLKFIKDNPDSWMSLFVLKCYGGFDYSILLYNSSVMPGLSELDSLYASLSVNVRSSKSGIEFGDLITRLKKTGIGFTAPDFTQPDSSGKSISLHDFKGKYVLIDFWASWCAPCRTENPTVVEAFKKYNTKGFAVLGVSLDYPGAKKAWLKAIHDDHLIWPQVSDLKGWKNEAAVLYGILSIPQNYLVDPAGKIIAVNLRGDDLEKTLKELNLH